ncbi:MAG: hypothetical protein B6I36_01545 [Desulfobacteraceae bacterium 4572_35.1]|nr:MAG: hypothetical protein B6I36_01545 [Desulfobacteraceae bacterium 4572_35.1]
MRTLLFFVFLTLLPLQLVALDSEDPYAIMHAYYKASGGLKRWQNLTSSYSAGSVVYDDLQGTFKLWEHDPLQYRLEEDFDVISQVHGDSGERAWRLDYNNQLELPRDPETLNRRLLASYLSSFEHLRHDSSIFTLHIEPQAQIDDQLCYVVRLDNTINSDVTRYFFSVKSLRLLATKTRQPDVEIYTSFSDYRSVDGFTIPFHQSEDISPRQKHHETQITYMELNPTIASAKFAVPDAHPPAVTFCHDSGGDTNKIEIPFFSVNGIIYLQVTIAGDTGWWLLDSGASSTVIDSDYALRLRVEPKGSIKGFGYGGNFNLTFVSLPGLSVAGRAGMVQLGAHTVMAYKDLSESSYEPTINGILGYDFLSHFVLCVDYGRQIITMYEPDSFLPKECDRWLDAPLQYHMFTLPVIIDNKYVGRWSLDLGAERSSFNAPYVLSYPELNRLALNGVESVSKGLVAPIVDRLVRFASLHIGDLRIDNQVISLPGAAARGSATIGELAGNLGVAQLKNFVLWLDYTRQRVCLQRGALFNLPEELDKSGMLVGLTNNDEPMISFVAEGSPAAIAGIKAGDLIVNINGKDALELGGVHAIRKLLRRQAGNCYTFVLQRGSVVVDIELCLKDML